ncbi:MAG: hypothetical protein JSS82_02405 [Bacteroidetes bacterium]|nr:hypothetical protein [Bacteroidota bacterium]
MNQNPKLKPWLIFLVLWALLFVLYLPAVKAGFVMDFTGWLNQVKNYSFQEYINRDNFHVKSMYQLWQLFVYVFYHIFGTNFWAWHLLFVTSQALVSYLLYAFFLRLFIDSGVAGASTIALSGTILYSICPHISEVVVWEPTYHYLQAMALLLLILICIRNYFKTAASKHIWLALLCFTLSLFSLEYFYITPLFVLCLALYYRNTPGYDKKLFTRIGIRFIVPSIALVVGRTLLFKLLYNEWISRVGSGTLFQSFSDYIVKPPRYVFHIIFLGRFFPHEVRQKVYSFCSSPIGLLIFYGLFVALCLFILVRYKSFRNKGKAAVLIFLFTILAMLIVLPMWFPELQLVTMDRYTYMLCAFIYMLIALLASYIAKRSVAVAVVALIGLVNLRYTIQVNRYWMKSARINNHLLDTYAIADDKITLLLDQPENMHGVPMIQATTGGEFKLMYNLLRNGHINGEVLDIVSMNMETPADGVFATVLNDSTIKITANQWGTWWWFDGFGAGDRENEYFKLHAPDAHWYELTLKKDPSKYRLLYQVGGDWKTVDWSKKNEDQH